MRKAMKEPPTTARWVDVSTLAEAWGLEEQTIRRHAELLDGIKLRSVPGRDGVNRARWRFPQSVVEAGPALLAARLAEAAEEAS